MKISKLTCLLLFALMCSSLAMAITEITVQLDEKVILPFGDEEVVIVIEDFFDESIIDIKMDLLSGELKLGETQNVGVFDFTFISYEIIENEYYFTLSYEKNCPFCIDITVDEVCEHTYTEFDVKEGDELIFGVFNGHVQSKKVSFTFFPKPPGEDVLFLIGYDQGYYYPIDCYDDSCARMFPYFDRRPYVADNNEVAFLGPVTIEPLEVDQNDKSAKIGVHYMYDCEYNYVPEDIPEEFRCSILEAEANWYNEVSEQTEIATFSNGQEIFVDINGYVFDNVHDDILNITLYLDEKEIFTGIIYDWEFKNLLNLPMKFLVNAMYDSNSPKYSEFEVDVDILACGLPQEKEDDYSTEVPEFGFISGGLLVGLIGLFLFGRYKRK